MPIPGIKSAVAGLGAPPLSALFVSAPASVIGSAGGVSLYSSVSIGANPGAYRWVYVCATAESNNDITGVNIGGAAASLVVASGRSTNPSPDVQAVIYRLIVPSGTTADIEVTGPISTRTCIAVFEIVGGDGAITQAVGNSGSASDYHAVATNIAPTKNSATIAVMAISPNRNATWQNITSASYTAYGGDSQRTGLRTDAAAAGPFTIDVVDTTSNQALAVCVIN